MIEMDTLAQAMDESQCGGPVGLEDMTWSASVAGKALVDIAVSLRKLTGRPLPETTPRQEEVAGKFRDGITDPEQMAKELSRFKWDDDYIKKITRIMLSDGRSDTGTDSGEGKPGNPDDGAKEERTTAIKDGS